MSKGMSSREIETRATPYAVELRGNGSRRIGGYGAVYNRKSRPLGAFVEVIESRAFAKSEADGWAGVVSRLEHKPELLLGSVAGGTLELRTDTVGIDYSVSLPNTSAGNDTLALVERGDIQNSSIAFQCYEDDFSYDGGELPVRHLVSVRVLDVSPTAQPAYPDATVGLRHLASQIGEDPDEILALARDRELRKLFVRTDLAPAVATRSADDDDVPISVRQKQVELAGRKIEWDMPKINVRQAQLELMRRKMMIDEGQPCFEQRSLPVSSWRSFDPRS